MLETEFITFPLKEANKIRNIKEGNCNVEETINEIQEVLAEVDILLLNSNLPKESNTKEINKIILGLLQ